ncbi:uncharacterized protein [Ptychodera flava]|uniref:uncharacterized protein n=1 Tax=Ptychodera flava TaxID=63121 RepID=UPI003969E0AF
MLLRGFAAILSATIVICVFTLFWINTDDDHFGIGYLPRPKMILTPEKTENKSTSGIKDARINISSSTSMKWQQTAFKSVNTNSSTRLLLYINAIGRGGPNCQYSHFKSALQYAVTQNRSLVNAIVFYEHRMFAAHAHEQPRDTRTLEETFDINQLKTIVNMISLEEFNANCNKTVETLLTSPKGGRHVMHAYSISAELYRSAFGVALPDYEQLPATNDQLLERLEEASSMNCVGVWALHFGGLSARTTGEKVIEHLVPSPGIQHAAESIRKNVLKGRPYLAIHWRNKPNELYKAMCEHVDSGHNKKCEYYRRDLTLMMNLTRNIAKSIQNFMKTNNLTQVYVATPPISTNFVRVFRSLGVANTFSAENITNDRHAEEKKDPYIWSLIEQDLCANADVFIGHYNSTWSRRVHDRRLGNMAKYLTIKDFAAKSTTELFSRRR